MKKMLRSFIPKRISNRTVIGFFEFLRIIQKICPWDVSKNYQSNIAAYSAHISEIKKFNGYIEDQHAYKDMAYGLVTMSYSGCEIIAVYNAINKLTSGEIMSLPDMISFFEKDGMVRKGRFGTSPKALSNFLKHQGFSTTFSTRSRDFEKLVNNYPCCLITMYNDKSDILRQVHSICISRENDGFTAHNVYCNGKIIGPYKSFNDLMDHINNGNSKIISVIGIDHK